MTENDTETEMLADFYEEVRERFRISMKAEGIDSETREAVIETVDDNV